MLLEGLMKRYEGAKLSDIRKLTINQILLLNHASSVNHERGEEYYDWKRQFEKKDDDRPKAQFSSDEMSSEGFLSSLFGGG